MVLSLVITVFALAGAFADVRTRRIPNRLVLAGLVTALVVRAGWGVAPLWEGVAGGAVALLVGFPLFALGAFGAGDVKFLSVCGALVGLPLVGETILFSAAAGLFVAVAVVARRRLPMVAALRSWNLLVSAVTLGRAGGRMKLTDEGVITAPYGVAIAAGALLVWFGAAGGLMP
ncbi:MAG TPA: A24 family peptidase [Longimicrobiales bacterium]